MLAHTNFFTEKRVLGEELKKSFGNDFIFVTSRPYIDKKGILPNGFTATLQVVHDSNDYGVDSRTGKPRDNNVFQTFDVTILDGTDGTQFQKGQHVRLGKFRGDISFEINFELILRYESMEAITNEQTKNKTSAV